MIIYFLSGILRQTMLVTWQFLSESCHHIFLLFSVFVLLCFAFFYKIMYKKSQQYVLLREKNKNVIS